MSLHIVDDEQREVGPITKELEIIQPSAGGYRLYVTGTDTGTYTLEIMAYDIDGNPSLSKFADVPISGDEVHTFNFNYPKTAGRTVPAKNSV